MKNLGVLCHCKYCQSDTPAVFDCGCPVEAGWHEHDWSYIIINSTKYEKERIVNTGGRHAEWIYLEDGEVAVFYSSNGNPMETVPYVPYEEIMRNYEMIDRFDASVHGCWKIQKHQTMEIYKKKEK